jgi:acyl dehydratase
MRTLEGPDEPRSLVGQELGVSAWLAVDEDRINLSADATDDHQWIHVDQAKASEGPFGTTVAHGYLTLALLPPLMNNIFEVTNKRMGVNYGLNKVRFPARCPLVRWCAFGSRSPRSRNVPDGVQVVWVATVERRGEDKPVCTTEGITRLYFWALAHHRHRSHRGGTTCQTRSGSLTESQ